MSTDSLYGILGLDPSVSDEQLREAFEQIERRLADATDLASAEELRIAKEAFAILSSRRKRGPFLEPRTLPQRETASPPKPAAPLESCDKPAGHSPSEIFLATIQQRAILVFLAVLAGLLIYRDIETTKSMVEIQRITTEKAMADIAARNKMLEAKNAETAQTQRESDEKKLELEAQRMDTEQPIKAQQIEMGPKSLDNFELANLRQAEAEKERIKAQIEKAHQELDLAQPTIQDETNQMNTQARVIPFKTEPAEYEIDRQSRTERMILYKYHLQHDGENTVTHSNPGLNRWW